MTAPGAGQDINLAALWIPVMPETSHMGEEMKKAGAESKKAFEEGFNSSGSSPESLGSSYSSKLSASISGGLKGFELPFGMSNMFEKFGQSVDTNVTQKLKGEASDALSKYRSEYDKLTEATNRASEAAKNQAQADANVKLARDNNISAAQVMLPLLEKQTQATKESTSAQTGLAEAHKSTGAALEDYSTKQTNFNTVTKEAGSNGTLLAGIMGGAMVAGAQALSGAVEAVAEHVIEGAVEAFKMGVEIGKEFADTMIELGETYEHLDIQIQEFSTASGEQLEQFNSHAQAVFGSLDVAGNNTGQTMAQFASMLNAEPSPALDMLTKHVEELQGRFSSLKGTDLAAIFNAFKVPVEQADTAMASLLQSARGSGQDFGVFTQALSGNVSVTLAEAGMNLQQAGAFMGDLMKLGEPGRQTMTGLASAMKEFGKEGLSFGDGMKLAGEKLKELGDTAEGQDMAEKLFGTRNWIVAKNAVQDYLDIVSRSPDAFNASAGSVDQFIEHTKNLENEWEIVKHKAEEAFLPMGEEALKLVGTGLDKVVQYIDTHMDQIKSAVKLGGVEMINFARNVQMLGEGLLGFFAPIADAIVAVFYVTTEAMAHFFDIQGKLLSLIPGFGDMGKSMQEAAQSAGAMGIELKNLNVGDKMRELADWSKQHPIDVKAASDSWTKFADNVGTSLDSANSHLQNFGQNVGAVQAPQGNWFGAPGNPLGGTGNASGFPMPNAAPGGSLFGPGGTGTTGDPIGSLGGSAGGVHHADWDAIAAKEGSGQWNITYTTGVPEGGGLQIKPGTWAMYGGTEFAPKPYQATKEQQEQVGERILNGWNGIPGQGPDAWEHGKTYVEKKAMGGAPGRSITQGSGSGDDVAALLGRGEYVWDTETMDKYGWLIKALHQGTVMGYDDGGGSNLDTKGAQVDTIAVAEAAQKLFGINDIGMFRSADGYNEHASGEAADVMVGNNKAEGDQVAQYFLQNAGQFGVQYVLWQQTQWNPDGTKVKMQDRGSSTANHMDHVHVRTLGGGFPQGADQSGFASPSSGQTSNQPSAVAMQAFGGAGSTPGGKNGAAFPGMAGQYGGSGAYGGETADEQYSTAKAVQSAQDRASDLDTEITAKQKRIQELKDELGQVGNEPGKTELLTGKPIPRTPAELAADDQKRKSINDQLESATTELTKSQRDRSEQDGVITEAQRKQQEAMYKKPTTTTTGQSAEGKAGETLGSGLLAGIGQELGLGDVLGKSPLDWGIVKLAEGLFNYANGLGNAIFGATGGSQGGGMTQSGGGGMLSGMASSLGLSLPKANVSSGPNIQAAQPGTPASGYGSGPAPGPVIQGDYMPIHVSSDVDPSRVTSITDGAKASQNASAFTQTGGFPAP